MTFDDIMGLTPANRENFNELVTAVNRITVVPFVGTGMSAPFYPTWSMAIDSLNKIVAPDQRQTVEEEMKSAATEIDQCDILERHIGRPRMCRALSEMYQISHFTEFPDPKLNEKAVALLPKLFPSVPLLTSNLERMIEDVFRFYNAPFDAVLSITDKNVIPILYQQRAHGILYLHGFVSGVLTDYNKLVFSKSQYDRHYQSGSDLVVGLQEWMKNAQLLFLGCSLRNDRSLDILKKVFDNHNRVEHFAILDLKPEDNDYTSRMIQLEGDYGIRAILYPEGQHEAVRIILERLLRETNYAAYTEYRNTLPALTTIVSSDDSRRFTPEARKTTLCGREIEFDKLKEFCNDARSFLWWAITAPGGSGKTRLMLELAEYEKSNGWSVKLLKSSEYNENIFAAIQNASQNLLVISDYAGDHARTLASWIERLSDHSAPKIRLLLAERNAGTSTNKMVAQNQNNDNAFFDVLEQLRSPWYARMKDSGIKRQLLINTQYGAAERFLELKQLDETAMKMLIQSYAKCCFVEKSLSSEDASMLYSILQEIDPGLCRPLYAMFITDAFIQKGNPQSWDRDTVLCDLIDREETHLLNRQKQYLNQAEEDATLTDEIRKLRLHATIHDGSTLDSVPAWLNVNASIKAYHRRPIEFLRYLHLTDAMDSAEASQVQISAVKPDLLGEFFVLKNSTAAHPVLFAPNWFLDTKICAFLDRMVHDYGDCMPREYWNEYFSPEPQTAVEAAAMLKMLFTATYNTRLDVKRSAVSRMENILERFSSLAGIQVLSAALYNLCLSQDDQDRPEILDKLCLLNSLFKDDHGIALIYAQALFACSVSQNLLGKAEIVKELRQLSSTYNDSLDIAIVFVKGLYNLSNTQPLSDRACSIREIQQLCDEHSDCEEIAVTYANGLVNLIVAQENAKDFEGCASTIEALKLLEKRQNNSKKVMLSIAKGLVNGIPFQRNTKDYSACRTSLSKILELYEQHCDDLEFTQIYAKGIYNSIADEKDAKSLEECREALKKLRTLYNRFPNDYDLSITYCKGALELAEIAGYSEKCSLVENVESIANSFDGISEIELVYARCLVNLTSSQKGPEEKLNYLSTVEKLHELGRKYKDVRETAIEFATVLVELIDVQCTIPDTKGCLDSINWLKDLVDLYADSRELNLVYADGLGKALLCYGVAHDFGHCKTSINELQRLCVRSQTDQEIPQIYAHGLLNLTYYFGDAHKVNDCKKYVRQLHNLSISYKNDSRITALYAKGLANLILTQSTEQDYAGRAVTLDSFRKLYDICKNDREVVLAYATGLFNLINVQNTDKPTSFWKVGLEKLKQLTLDHPDLEEVSIVYAKALYNSASVEECAKRKDVIDQLWDLCRKRNGNSIIALICAKGLHNLARLQKLPAIMDTIDRLRIIAQDYADDKEIATAYENSLKHFLGILYQIDQPQIDKPKKEGCG